MSQWAASEITGVQIVFLAVCSGADQRKHQSSVSLAFVRGINQWPVHSSHNGQQRRNVSIWWRHHILTNIQVDSIALSSELMNIWKPRYGLYSLNYLQVIWVSVLLTLKYLLLQKIWWRLQNYTGCRKGLQKTQICFATLRAQQHQENEGGIGRIKRWTCNHGNVRRVRQHELLVTGQG